ncbi:MAG: hypothetical protein NT129_00845 [Candidatus Aenigmarchaeota archaeon]|nr:hypothetical protein [Candidatus Aenigmarchaeota archaeon]
MKKARNMRLIKMEELDKTAICDDCRKFARKFRPWDESRIPDVAITKLYGCNECSTSFEVYKNMCLVMRRCK